MLFNRHESFQLLMCRNTDDYENSTNATRQNKPNPGIYAAVDTNNNDDIRVTGMHLYLKPCQRNPDLGNGKLGPEYGLENKKLEKVVDEKKEDEEDDSVPSIRKSWRKFCGRTSLQGISNMGQTTAWWKKGIWLCVFLCAITGAIIQTTLIVVKYLEYESNVAISIRTSTQPFPSVTICNQNSIRLSQTADTVLEKFIKMNSLPTGYVNISGKPPGTEWVGHADPVYDFGSGLTGDEETGYGPRSLHDRKLEEYNYLVGLIPLDQRKEKGHQAKRMIRDCTFNGRLCSHQNFSHSFSRDFGNCYTFNSHDIRNFTLVSKRSGIRFGLSLVLYTEEFEYVRSVNHATGFKFRIHPYGTKPTMGDFSFSVAPGFKTYIALYTDNVTRLGKQFTPCGDVTNFTSNLGYEYTREGCLDTCEDRLIAEQCGCMRPDYVENYSKKQRETLRHCVCEMKPNEKHDCGCMWDAIESIIKSSMPCKCRSPCKEKIYNVRHSSTRWPDPGVWYQLISNLCDTIHPSTCERFKNVSAPQRQDHIRANLASVKIYIQTLTSKIMEEVETYESSQFWSDFGGTVGLYVGASLVTAVEAVELLVEIFAILCLRRK